MTTFESTRFPPGSRVIEWDNGEDPLRWEDGTACDSGVPRLFRPTGRLGVVELWSPDSLRRSNLKRLPPCGSKVIRVLRKDGSQSVDFIRIASYRKGYVYRLSIHWHSEGFDPNSKDFVRRKLLPALPAGKAKNHAPIRDTAVVAAVRGMGIVAAFLGILGLSYAVVPMLLIRLHLGWLVVPALLYDMWAWHYANRQRRKGKYLPIFWRL